MFEKGEIYKIVLGKQEPKEYILLELRKFKNKELKEFRRFRINRSNNNFLLLFLNETTKFYSLTFKYEIGGWPVFFDNQILFLPQDEVRFIYSTGAKLVKMT